MFSIVTIYTAIELDLQSIAYIDNREFPGLDGRLPPGPLGYEDLIYSKGKTDVVNIMCLLNGGLADGLLVSYLVFDPVVREVFYLGRSSSYIVATSFIP